MEIADIGRPSAFDGDGGPLVAPRSREPKVRRGLALRNRYAKQLSDVQTGGFEGLTFHQHEHNSRDVTAEVDLRMQFEGAERAQRESENRFEQMFRSAPVALSIATAGDGRIIHVNDAWAALVGYGRDEAVGKSVFDVGMWSSESERRRLVTSIVENGPVVDWERSFRTRTGHLRDVLSSWSVVSFNGEQCVLAMAIDITESKRIRAELRASESRNRELLELLEHGEDAVFATDLQGRFTAVNPATERLTGYTARELQSLSLREIVCDESFEALREAFGERDPERHRPASVLRIRTKAGAIRAIEVASRVTRRLGQPAAIQAIARDVTRRQAEQETLQAAHEEVTRLLGAAPVALAGLNREHHVTLWNTTTEAVLGISADDVLGRAFPAPSLLGDGANGFWTAVERVWSTGAPERVDDLRFVRADGRPGILGLTISAIDDGSGAAPSDILIAAVDVTERRTLERQLAQAQKLESIGQLAAGIAHEINTPTQYVSDNIHFLHDAFVSLRAVQDAYVELAEACTGAGSYQDMLDRIRTTNEREDIDYLVTEIPRAIEQSLDGVQRVTKIVRAMKDFSHPGTADKVMVDINHAIESIVTVARNEWKYVAELILDLSSDLPMVPCYPSDVNQVILNVVVNSAHAIGDRLGPGATNKGVITVSTREVDGTVEIRIADTGGGMPHSIVSRVFDPFFTTKEVGRGTGQGLAISYDVIVRKHGGTIAFDTVEGEGTTCVIRLPLRHMEHEES